MEVDKSLDEIIKDTRMSRPRGRGRGAGAAAGLNRATARQTPNTRGGRTQSAPSVRGGPRGASRSARARPTTSRATTATTHNNNNNNNNSFNSPRRGMAVRPVMRGGVLKRTPKLTITLNGSAHRRNPAEVAAYTTPIFVPAPAVASGWMPVAAATSADDGAWQHDQYQRMHSKPDLRTQLVTHEVRQAPAPAAKVSLQAQNISTGTKVLVMNLDGGVSQSDMQELFETVGPLKKVAMGMQGSDRVAQITFQKKQDALAAITKYNGVHLDGKPMKMQLMAPPAEQRSERVAPAPAAPQPASSRLGTRSGHGGGAVTFPAAPVRDVTFSVRL